MNKEERHKDYLVINHNRIQFLMSSNKNKALFKEEIVGHNNANINELYYRGLPIPPAFIVSTKSSHEYLETGALSKDTVRCIQKAVCELETQADKVYAASLNDYLVDKIQDKKPLLLTVKGECIVPPFRRAGPVENIGMNDTIAKYFTDTYSIHTATCVYCNFVRSFGSIVLDISDSLYNDIVARQLQQQHSPTLASLNTTALQEVLTEFLLITPGIPDDPYEQLQMSIEAMYRPWMPSSRAGASFENCSLQEKSLEATAGIAVRVQQAVFGSGESYCGSGKVHTDPSSALDVVNYTLQYLPTGVRASPGSGGTQYCSAGPGGVYCTVAVAEGSGAHLMKRLLPKQS